MTAHIVRSYMVCMDSSGFHANGTCPDKKPTHPNVTVSLARLVYCVGMRHLICIVALLATVMPSIAGKADVIAASARKDADGTYTISVTIKSDDTGWEKYADRWEVVAKDGTVLGLRVLAHPHETEQPFTREQSGIALPPGTSEVIIRAHDKVEGFGGAEFKLALPQE